MKLENRVFIVIFAAFFLSAPLSAQVVGIKGPEHMPSGDYVVETSDIIVYENHPQANRVLPPDIKRFNNVLHIKTADGVIEVRPAITNVRRVIAADGKERYFVSSGYGIEINGELTNTRKIDLDQGLLAIMWNTKTEPGKSASYHLDRDKLY